MLKNLIALLSDMLLIVPKPVKDTNNPYLLKETYIMYVT